MIAFKIFDCKNKNKENYYINYEDPVIQASINIPV